MVLFDALLFPFKDSGWIGKTVATALSAFLFLPPYGYMLRIAQQVSDGEEASLPQHQIGKEFGLGLQVFLATIIYFIPLAILGNLFSGGRTATPSAASTLTGLVLAIPFGLAAWLGLLRFVTIGSFWEFFNLPKSYEFLMQHLNTILVYFIQIAVGVGLIYTVSVLSVFTICGPLLGIAWMMHFIGFMSGSLARKLGLKWQYGRGNISFEG